jgi:hypothetical protein
VQNSGRYHELRWSVEIPDEREEYRADLSKKFNEFIELQLSWFTLSSHEMETTTAYPFAA